MTVAVPILVGGLIGVILLHWHGVEAARLAAWERSLDEREAALVHPRLAARGLTARELSMVEHSRIIYDQDLTEDARSVAPVGDAPTGTVPPVGADTPWVDSL